MSNEALQPLLAKADELYGQNQLEDALDAYQIILEQDDTVAWAHNRVGAILAQMGREEEAEASFLKALEMDGALPQAHSNLGNLYFNRQQYEQALEKYQQAIVLDPNNPVFHQNLHAAYKKLKRYSDAVRAMKQAARLEKEAGRAEVRETMAKTRERSKRGGCLRSATLTLLALAGLLVIVIF